MSMYIEPVADAATVFPFIGVLVSMIFVLAEFTKHKAVSFPKLIIVNIFTLYMLCAYCLIILPLPDMSVFADGAVRECQLIPFSFVSDFIRETPLRISTPSTLVKAVTDSSFLVPVFNIILTVPFGIFMRYFFRCNLKKTAVLTFSLSLFFELTQLTGLYFIYPGSYRLFDVDDLMLNTLGGVAGFFIAGILMKILPSIDSFEEYHVTERHVSGFRRGAAFVLDICICFTASAVLLLFGRIISAVCVPVICFFVIPSLMNGSTLGEKTAGLRIVNENGTCTFRNILSRNVTFLMTAFAVPLSVPAILVASDISEMNAQIIFAAGGFVMLYSLLFLVRYFFSDSEMLYEKLSGTHIEYSVKNRASVRIRAYSNVL